MSGGVGGINGPTSAVTLFASSYSLFDPLTLAVTYWMTENIRENPAGSDSDARGFRWTLFGNSN
jgi:hypothetical protein